MIKGKSGIGVLGFLFCQGILFLCSGVYSQTILSGSVLDDASSTPIANATVSLHAAGKAVLTGSDGKFTISANSGVINNWLKQSASSKIAIKNGRMSFNVPGNNAKVDISIFNLNGRLSKSIVKGKFNKGIHHIPMVAGKKSTGIEVIKWSIGNEQGSLRMVSEIGSASEIILKTRKNAEVGLSLYDTVITDRYGYFSDIRRTETPTEDITIRLKKMPQDSIVPPGMKLIEGNTFIMGSESGESDETPIRLISLSSYYVDSTEVTQMDFETLLHVKPWTNPVVQTKGGNGPRQPAWGINWYDAIFYCNERSKCDGLDTVYKFLKITGTPGDGCTIDSVLIDYVKNGYRLLTEAEWEYACAGGKRTTYFWGNNSDSAQYFLWYFSNSNYASQNVGQKKPNLFSLYDISGNVYEWINDWESGYYDPKDTVNPAGPLSPPDIGLYKIKRGGSWYHAIERVTDRKYAIITSRYGFNGFRVALPKR